MAQTESSIEQLYEDFLTDPDSVDANWRSTLQQLPGTGVKPDQFHSQTREYPPPGERRSRLLFNDLRP
ncbi:2-oxoglutarate dehydrogenase E1 subunit family protein [Escherichia coli]